MRILIVRLAAIGDALIITPLIRHLYNQGNEVYLLTSEIGEQILQNNPYVAKMKVHPKDSIPMDALDEYFKSHQQAWECDELINLCESIEVNLSLFPLSPRYKYPLFERRQMCNKNFYEETFRFAKVNLLQGGTQTYQDWAKDFFRPEMFFSKQEESQMYNFFRQFKDKFVILWALSGSARQKTYPYITETINMILQKYKDTIVITVGDEICKVLERDFNDKRIIKKSGLWNIRESIFACKYASCVISPDTGILHGSGCFDTPKIGLLTHTTVENITKYFKNDYSIECGHDLISCSPCYQQHYQSKITCNFDIDGYVPLCMKFGIPPEKILEQIERIKNARTDK